MGVEGDQAALPHPYALALEQLALHGRAHGIVDGDPATERAGLADHALPRQLVGGPARLHRGACHPRAAREAREGGDLPVGRHRAARDRPDHGVDPPVQLAQVLRTPIGHRELTA